MKEKEFGFKPLLVCLMLACFATPAFALKILPPPAHVAVQNGWVRWLPANLPAAGYAVIHNDGDKPVTIVGAASPEYGVVMLHRSMQENGKDTMRMVRAITIPAHGTFELSPGGYHLMLMDAKHPIKPGDKVPVQLIFAGHQMFQATWPVKPANVQ